MAAIRIGAVVATQGPTALLGQSFLKAVQFAKEELRSTTHQYDLVVEENPEPGPGRTRHREIDRDPEGERAQMSGESRGSRRTIPASTTTWRALKVETDKAGITWVYEDPGEHRQLPIVPGCVGDQERQAGTH